MVLLELNIEDKLLDRKKELLQGRPVEADGAAVAGLLPAARIVVMNETDAYYVEAPGDMDAVGDWAGQIGQDRLFADPFPCDLPLLSQWEPGTRARR